MTLQRWAEYIVLDISRNVNMGLAEENFDLHVRWVKQIVKDAMKGFVEELDK